MRVVIATKPRHLNPAVQSGTITGIPGSQIFASLLRIDRNWNYHPYLAEQWKVAKDGLSVTFYLRKNAVFHDGRPITSEDVAFSILAVKEHHPFSTMLAAVTRVETPDPLTAIVRLKQPHPALLSVAGSPMLPIIPKHIYGDGQDLKTHPANWKAVGSGPFQLSEVNDKSIVLERNKNFFLPGKPYLDRVIIAVADIKSHQIAFEVGDVHLKGFTSELAMIDKLKQGKKILADYDSYDGVGSLMWLAFNLRKPPFDDLRVRQAFAYAIDRKFLISTMFEGIAREATGPISPGTPFYSNKVEHYEINIMKANKLLDEAGYTRDAKGIRFSTTLDTIPANSINPEKLSQYLRVDLLRKIGVSLELVKSGSFSDWAERISNGDFSLTLDVVFNWGDPVIGVHRTYSSKNIRKGVIWSNTQGYINPDADTLMEKAGIETDPEKRKMLYAEFQQIVAGDLPVYWIAKLPYATVYHRNLEGVGDSIWGIMFPYDEIRWKE